MTRRGWRTYAIAALVVVLATAATQLAMGRIPICKCGYVKLWHGIVISSENSQHISDWYTPSHVIHGVAFYALLWLAARRANSTRVLGFAVTIMPIRPVAKAIRKAV